MGDYGHEIPKEINDERLTLIKLYDGSKCPVCNENNTLTLIVDETYPHEFNQGIHIFQCDKCGIIAREYVNYIGEIPSIYWYRYNQSNHME